MIDSRESLGAIADRMARRVRDGDANFKALVEIADLDPAKDFVGADLTGVDFKNEDLSGFDFRRADLSYSDFSGANLAGCLLTGALMVGTIGIPEYAGTLEYKADRQPAPSILVLFAGRRAEEISRSIEPPDWSPDRGGADLGWRFVVAHGKERRDRHPFVGLIQVAAVGADLPGTAFDVIVVLADSDSDVDASLDWINAKLDSKIRLLAPAPPRDRPSRLLTDQPARGFNAVIDTSIARSPFWSGNVSRALDRRIADTAIGVATVVSSSDDIATRLSQMEDPRTPVVTLAFGPAAMGSSQAPVLSLSSEAVGLVRVDQGLPDLFHFQPYWIRQRPKDAELGLFLISSDLQASTSSFLHAAADHALARRKLDLIDGNEIPADILGELAFSGHSAGLRASTGRGPATAIVAETPTMKLVHSAAKVGWRVARYTDGLFIAETLSPDAPSSPRQLPNELVLPKARRRPENRGLVTRGADSRDILVFKEAFVDRIRSDAPDLARSIRQFRPAFAQPGILEFMVPTYEVSQWLADDHDKSMRAELDSLRAGKPRVPKRPADLRVACGEPAPDAMRFAIADGLLPVRLDQLARHEVPAQSMFIIDGDAAVPALLQSSVFAVWARATATRSTSWMAARFSVTGTFETFPIVGAFDVASFGPGNVQLRLVGDERLYGLARDWLVEMDKQWETGQLAEKQGEIRRHLDEEILGLYRLSPDADDLQILERLLELNEGD
ncbi:pentapeptide repeat-containing protein [Sphingomonas sp. ERG5]|uniref:pentapeptide repeat-containing protein n=1 Tax=Sphingomonas sp. ERG5 TaxID=1381597 RepID=UPI00054C51A7|nr:pentapeptide repeat-containing protein [Sphingomonas sp. ERG5]